MPTASEKRRFRGSVRKCWGRRRRIGPPTDSRYDYDDARLRFREREPCLDKAHDPGARSAEDPQQTAVIVTSPSDLTYEIWTDGACAHKTTGAGGYAAVLVARRSDGTTSKQWDVSGGAAKTTNNEMELMAVIAGLRELPAPARVCIFIDSTYVKKNFEDRLEHWRSNGWRTADGKEVKNRDRWKELFTEVACRKVKWVQVPGHSGVPLNERADQLACSQRDAYADRGPRRPVE
jgi:ribonuclease HI